MRKRTKFTTLDLPHFEFESAAYSDINQDDESDSVIQRNFSKFELEHNSIKKQQSNLINPEYKNNNSILQVMGWQKLSIDPEENTEICKDYFTTGYCTYGHECKFVHTHDRVASGYNFDRVLEKTKIDTSRLDTGIVIKRNQISPNLDIENLTDND
ncbi:hypothetical protein TVAG_200630 [Trichomonas vaginalis G3]|uniref:C3H1-type domain-containing protein n=1 Tax=Trichomonas vaginalis (strain ATCC PRA-98 / G3) TaxID=412133 RepID=A2FRZ9_TRIV3|nr:hypothetical protein TVAG_200630 [Trichomonas vaginalis G3]|eukprot:XP_001305257.1 hypothetical protein [Trichomonas vaginalis G3]